MATPPTRVSYNVPSTGNYSATGTSKVTASFNVQSGDLIVVLASSEGAASINSVTPSASGGSLTWTSRAQQPASASSTSSLARCWSGAVGATATGITVTLNNIGDSSNWWGLSATVWRNHGGVGSVFSGNNAAGSSAPSVAASCSANSAVMCTVNDWNAVDGTTRTWRTINGSAQSEATYFRNSTHHTVYSGYTLDVGAAASITQGLTVPSTMRWVLVGLEILGTTGPSAQTFNPTAITSAEAFGATVIDLKIPAAPSPISSAEAFGSVVANMKIPLAPSPINSAEALGAVVANMSIPAAPNPISSAEAFGTTAIATALNVSPTAITSAESFGSVTLSLGQSIQPTGISSAEAVNDPTINHFLTLNPTAIISAEAFGTPSANQGIMVAPVGVATNETFGNVQLLMPIPVSPNGIASSEIFGIVEVTGDLVIFQPEGTKRDILYAELGHKGYIPGGVTDRLYDYEEDQWVESAPVEPVSINDYLTYSTTSEYDKKDLQ